MNLRRRGLTIPEVLITAVIVAIIAVYFNQAIISSVKVSRKASDILLIQQAAQNFLNNVEWKIKNDNTFDLSKEVNKKIPIKKLKNYYMKLFATVEKEINFKFFDYIENKKKSLNISNSKYVLMSLLLNVYQLKGNKERKVYSLPDLLINMEVNK